MSTRGIFGGTFDPVHWGHLEIAQTALHTYNLGEVIWIPQLVPPHKIPVTPIEHRWSMVALAIASYPQFRLPATLKLWQNLCHHPDYAIDTFCLLQELYPGTRWFWILGADSFLTLPRWKGRERLIPACIWLVATRNLQNLAQLQQVAGELQAQGIEVTWELLPMETIAISSSLVRQTHQANQSVDHLLPAPVQQYIIEQSLYPRLGSGAASLLPLGSHA